MPLIKIAGHAQLASGPKPAKNESMIEEKTSEPAVLSVTNSMNSSGKDVATKVEEKAAKERFMSALARFQINTVANLGQLRETHSCLSLSIHV